MGTAYEKLAGEYLKQHGYQILQYNFSCYAGEIDIVAQHEGYLVFVEVKFRASSRMGNPLEAVTVAKQRKISKTAMYYCLSHGFSENVPCRFDVAAVLGEKIKIVKNAFEFCG